MRRNTMHDFWERVADGPVTVCWPWLGGLNRCGYGRIRLGRRKKEFAHRVAYAVAYGEPAAHPNVVHSCHNSLCCNPAHLRTGTHADNMRDKVLAGRAVGLKGASNPSAKLTDDDIRMLRATSDSHVAAAQRLGISRSVVCAIRLRRTWKHVA